jgi:type II secretory pathway component PulF
MPLSPEDVTLGEVARSLAAFRLDVSEKFAQMNHRLDTMEFVPRGEHNLQINELKERVAVLEDNKKWMSRTLVASFLYPVLVAVVVAMVVLR